MNDYTIRLEEKRNTEKLKIWSESRSGMCINLDVLSIM